MPKRTNKTSRIVTELHRYQLQTFVKHKRPRGLNAGMFAMIIIGLCAKSESSKRN